MQITRLFNIQEEDIWKNNILVPICVWNKFFLNGTEPTQKIIDYIKRSLGKTKEKVLIIVVDKIQISNRIVRNSKHTVEQNMRRLIKKWFEIKINIQKFLKTLSEEQQKNIEVISRDEYEKEDPLCKKTTEIIYKEFEENIEFRNEILESIKKSVIDRKFNEEEYLTLCKYVLDEFSLAYHGPTYKNIFYWLYVYPYTDEVLEVIEKIKIGDFLPEINNKLDNKKISVILLN